GRVAREQLVRHPERLEQRSQPRTPGRIVRRIECWIVVGGHRRKRTMRAMRIAAAQVHPAWLDTPRTTAIVTDWIGRAANEGVELLAFGATFLGGYPLWIGFTDGARWNDADQKRAFAA